MHPQLTHLWSLTRRSRIPEKEGPPPIVNAKCRGLSSCVCHLLLQERSARHLQCPGQPLHRKPGPLLLHGFLQGGVSSVIENGDTA